jgi:hypothetical protein
MTTHRWGRAWCTQHLTQKRMQDHWHWPDKLDAGQQQVAGNHVASRSQWLASHAWQPQAPQHAARIPAQHARHASVLQPVMSEQQDAVAYSPVQHGFLNPDWGIQAMQVASAHWSPSWDLGSPSTQPASCPAPETPLSRQPPRWGPAIDFGQPGEPFRPMAPNMHAAGQATASVPMTDMHRSWQHTTEHANPQQVWDAGQAWQSSLHAMPQVPPAMACWPLPDPMGVHRHVQPISSLECLYGQQLDWQPPGAVAGSPQYARVVATQSQLGIGADRCRTPEQTRPQ